MPVDPRGHRPRSEQRPSSSRRSRESSTAVLPSRVDFVAGDVPQRESLVAVVRASSGLASVGPIFHGDHPAVLIVGHDDNAGLLNQQDGLALDACREKPPRRIFDPNGHGGGVVGAHDPCQARVVPCAGSPAAWSLRVFSCARTRVRSGNRSAAVHDQALCVSFATSLHKFFDRWLTARGGAWVHPCRSLVPFCARRRIRETRRRRSLGGEGSLQIEGCIT